MDDPSARAPPEGARATTLGGPKLDGAISYGNRAGTVGEPRPELGGDSLLEYHRKRYPARVALLERADPAAEAVWLTPLRAGASPMAYPAELLAVIGGSGSRSRGAPERSMDPAETQRLVTAVRARLGQPFAPVATLSDRMTRLPSPNTASSGPRGALVGAGGLAGGPARPPKSTNEIHRDANATARTPANATARTFTRDAPRVLLMSRGDPEETRARASRRGSRGRTNRGVRRRRRRRRSPPTSPPRTSSESKISTYPSVPSTESTRRLFARRPARRDGSNPRFDARRPEGTTSSSSTRGADGRTRRRAKRRRRRECLPRDARGMIGAVSRSSSARFAGGRR